MEVLVDTIKWQNKQRIQVNNKKIKQYNDREYAD